MLLIKTTNTANCGGKMYLCSRVRPQKVVSLRAARSLRNRNGCEQTPTSLVTLLYSNILDFFFFNGTLRCFSTSSKRRWLRFCVRFVSDRVHPFSHSAEVAGDAHVPLCCSVSEHTKQGFYAAVKAGSPGRCFVGCVW